MSWRIAVRIARREALRNRGRSALVVAMIALPVAGAAAADTLWRSAEVTGAAKLVREMGQYDARISVSMVGPLYQNPDGSQVVPVDQNRSGIAAPGQIDPASQPTGPADPAGLAALLPPGARISAPLARWSTEVLIVDDRGRGWAQVAEGDLADPLQRGMTRFHAGTAPKADDQVAISQALAAELHKGVGDTIEARVQSDTSQPSKRVHVTGVYDSADTVGDSTIFARHGVFEPSGGRTALDYLVSVPGGVGWDLVQRLNQHGFSVESKKVVADPPPRSQVPYYAHSFTDGGSSNPAELAVPVVALSMVLLEVVLLAGPAFAVGARRRRREFGLLGAAGADARGVRRVVLADGVVLGAVGGVVGVVVGVVGAAIGFPYLGHLSREVPGGFRVVPTELLAAVGLGVLTGVVAAVAPALSTARQSVLTALTGRRGQRSTPWKLTVTGLCGIVLGAGLMGYGALRPGSGTAPLSIGIVLAELGVVACTPLLLAWSVKLARWLPMTGRMALRDGARNRGRTAPAVAAVMAAVAGASTVAMLIASQDAQHRAQYGSQLRLGEAAVNWSPNATGTPADLIAQIKAVFPVKEAAVLSGLAPSSGDGPSLAPVPTVLREAAKRCPVPPAVLTPEQSVAFYSSQRSDPRCATGGAVGMSWRYMTGNSSVVSGGPELIRALAGHEDKAAEAVLAAGGVVVFNRLDLSGSDSASTVTFGWSNPCGDATGPNAQGTKFGAGVTGCPELPAPTSMPGAFVDAPLSSQVGGVVSPATAQKLGLRFTPQAILFDTTRMPTADEEKKADDLVGSVGIADRFQVERGYTSTTVAAMMALAAVAGVVMLGAAAVATGLAITDAQNDLETLAAVGARPRVRRTLAGSQAAVTAGLGAVLGGAFGLGPAVALVVARANSQHAIDNDLGPVHVYLAVPWLFLGLVIVALPTVAAAGASAVTRSRIELRRRRA